VEVVPPRDDLEQRLQLLWRDVLGIEGIGVTQSFFDLGGHSLLAVRLAAAIEREFGARLSLATFFHDDTIAALAARLRDHEAPNAGSAAPRSTGPPRPSGRGRPPAPRIVVLQKEGRRPPLWLVHEIAGTLFCYAPLVRRLKSGRPVFGLESPGIGGGGAIARTIERLARAHAVVVRGLQPHGPYRLAGWSFGGVLAFEIGRALARDGADVAAALFDSRPPGASRTARSGPGVDLEALPEGAESVDSALERSEQIARAHLDALARYRPRALRGRALLIRASRQEPEARDRDLGWSRLVRARVEIHDVAGDHFDLLRPPVVDEVAELLQGWLDRMDSGDVSRGGDRPDGLGSGAPPDGGDIREPAPGHP